MVLHQTKKVFAQTKKTIRNTRKAAKWMGEDIFKWYSWPRVYQYSNIQRMLTTQNQTNKQPNYKIEDLNMFPRNRTDDQQAYEKMPNIANY